MRILFSDHSRDRLLERNINKSDIIEVVNNPDEIVSSSRNRKLYRKRFLNKVLEVVITKEDKNIIIITAYYLEK